MPYRIGRPQSREVLGRKALGVRFPFNAPGVFSSSYRTLDAYKNNILNYFLTAKGERYLNPAFGNTIARYLFESTLSPEEIQYLRNQILVDLGNYFPRLVVKSLEITQYEVEQILQISLRFTVENLGMEDEVTINYNQ